MKKQLILITSSILIFILLAVFSSSSAQNNHFVYLPLVQGEQGAAVPVTTGGAAKIAAAGEFDLAPESELAPSGEKSEPVTSTVNSEGPLQSITCTNQEWSASDVRDLTDRLAFGTDIGIIYPGALIQGNSYLNGTFTPITIPRSGGTITMEGVTLQRDESYSRDLSVVSPDEVQNAVKDILAGYLEGGTTANYGDDFQQTYSYEHMLFTLGVDARYGIGTMEGDLSIDTEKETNYVFYKFQQVFYDVVYSPPESSTSVFRDGEGFTEPDPLSPQIGPGNPPLYVHKVSYGRIVYFVAEARYSATDIEATLKAAVDGKGFEGGLESGLTYEEVMDETRITTFVLGGNAGDAVQNVKAGSAEERFRAITEFVANDESANFSFENPAAPISYELRYLKNRQLARMSYTTTFDKKDCTSELVFPEPEPEEREMWIRFTDVDENVRLFHNGNRLLKIDDEDSPAYYKVNEWISASDGDETFELKLDPGFGDGGFLLTIYIDGKDEVLKTRHYNCDVSFPLSCTNQSWKYTVNVAKGTWDNQ